MIDKVYIIRYEEFDDSNGTSSGVSYVYSNKEQALEKFKMIRQEVIDFANEEEREYEIIEENISGYIKDFNGHVSFLIQYECGNYEEYILEERSII